MVQRIEIMLSWVCNNNCVFCGEGLNRKEAIEKNILVRSYFSVEEDLKTGRMKGATHVTFLGGEPTIYKDIFKVVTLAKRLGYETVFIATNARMCSNEDFAKKLVQSGVSEVSVSIHGSCEQVHDASTRVKGSFDQTIKGIENLLKITKVMTNTTINSENYKDLLKIIKMLNNYRLERVLITYPHIIGNAFINADKIPTYNDCRKYLLEAISLSKNKVRVMNVPLCVLEGHEEVWDNNGFEPREKLSPIGSTKNRYTTGSDYKKLSVCKDCKYDFICPGVHCSTPPRIESEIAPVPGKKISVFAASNNKIQTSRVEMNIGLACNNDCLFCISGHNKKGIDSTENILREIDKYSGKDVDSLNLLGGEPTLLPDLPEIIAYSRKIGFKNIHIITNGRRLSNAKFTKSLVENGLNRFSITLHGHNPVLQDEITQRKYSFLETVQGIYNVNFFRKKLNKNVKLTVGHVVNKLNYEHLVDMARFVKNLGADEFLLININPNGNCSTYYDQIVPKYSDIIPHIKNASEFCKKNKLPMAFDGFAHCIVAEYADFLGEDFNESDEATVPSGEFGRDKFDWISKRQSFKTKIDKCNECIYDSRCEGIWNQYVEKYGTDDFKPKIRSK